MAGWKRLAKATADGTSSTLSVSFTANDVIKLQVYAENTSGAGNFQIRFNNDTTANRHKTRRVYDGAGTSSNRYDDYSDTKFISNSATGALQSHMIIDVHNIDNEEHLVMGNCVESGATGTGSTGVPHTVNWMGKYTQKTPQVTSVQLITSSNNLNDKSYIIVLTTEGDTVTDEKTTISNVEAGTRYEETDTRKIYRYLGAETTPTRTETFTADNWVDSDSSCAGVQTNNNRLWFNANNGGDNQDDSTVYDLGSGNVSDTQWVLRWEYVRLGGGGSGNGHNHTFGLAKNDQTYHSGDSTDAIMMGWGEPQNSGQSYMGIQALNNSTGNSNGHFPTSGSRVSGINLTQDQTYYMELKRESASKATFTIWSDEYGGTALSGFPLSNTSEVSSSLADLRYIKWQNRGHDGTRSGTLEGSIKNVKFWNDIASIPASGWVERGSA